MENLQLAEERREVKSNRERESYTPLNAEFQRIARSDKKVFFNEQCKEMEENNRMGKTSNLFKKVGDIKGIFLERMDTIKNRNGMEVGGGFRMGNTCTPVADSC